MTFLRRVGIAGASALAVFALTACTNDEPTPTVTVTATPSAPAVPVPSDPFTPEPPVRPATVDDEYLYDLRTEMSIPPGLEDEVIGLGKTICGALETGAEKGELVQIIMDNNFTENQAIVFVAAAVVNYCPQFSEQAGV